MSWRNPGASLMTQIRDYSQDHEQEHILEAMKDISIGKFLDIGAFHPTNLSNTRALWELGWSGVLVEPSPSCMLSLLKEYGSADQRISLISVVVVPDTVGCLKSMLITDGPYSTIDAQCYTKWQGTGGYYGSVYVPALPIEALLQWFGPFDFIDIDVEGGSVDLFRRMLELNVKPKCVCVEYDEHLATVQHSALDAGYKQVFKNATNIIFAV